MVAEVVYTMSEKLQLHIKIIFADAKASKVHVNLESPKDQTFYLPCFGLKTEPWLV